MTISLKHAFQSAKADGADASLVRPSNWNAEHTLTMATARLLGRSTAGTGVAEEISLGTGLSFSGTQLQVNAVTALGFTPVQQGGGTGQGTNKVYIGWGSGSQLLLQVDASNFGNYWPIHISGQANSARRLKQNGVDGGTDMTFNWSGQSGQPSWLWGGNDGTNHYVYNPSNFNVNYANGAGNADTVDGYHATDLAQIYKGTASGNTNFGLGTIICARGLYPIRARNSTLGVALFTGDSGQFILADAGGGVGTALAGTWAFRGLCWGDGSVLVQLMQRIS